ncbi:uncharacterized protein LOC109717405 isoform X2 [Ananas comosus]|uniref:Uncharacterized protein LOC109717405 isoform X2 n=1 Tax=Ananas comosus TaxID=4615 RepID=A0A199VE18_ANACO|nr:uncharacterized protein LOC109717405 isoform X2 [Ananas comosus]OAY75258.1 hypothetical protein ACMD2_11129 [Ananas comosus]
MFSIETLGAAAISMAEAAEEEEEGIESSSDALDADSELSGSPGSFEERLLSAAEAEEPPPPGVEDLDIAGAARPGRLVHVRGFAVHGTVSCDFAWVRYSDNGNHCYITGENKDVYLVTADDVDSYLAIEVVPIGKGEQKGELLRTFANDHRKVSCDAGVSSADPKMQHEIERNFFLGHASYNVSVKIGYSNRLEKAKLAIRKQGFSVKKTGSPHVTYDQKFLPSTAVTIPKEHSTGVLIDCSQRTEPLLLIAESSSLRDEIVLTMRLFIQRATEKKKRRRWCLFF